MKKYIFSALMAAMTAFTFSSCEDVPEPYTMPSKPAEPGTTVEGNPAGTGTAADPFNCAAAVQYCNSLESGVESTQDVYVKGKVQSIEEQFSANYGNCSVTLYDEDSNVTFKVWRAYYFDNKKWTSDGKTINVGDELVFCGKVMNYAGNTPETVQSKAYLYSINGETSGGSSIPAAGEAKGTGTAADPFNSVAAQNYTTALAADQTTEQEFYIKGKIQSIDTQFAAQYGNASVHIADDANSQQFYVFRIYYFGGEKWKEGDGLLNVGDEIVVCAKLVNYKGNTPETSQGGKLISVNGKTSISGGDTPSTPDTPATGENEISISNMVSSETLPENSYGSQVAATESTWFTWKSGNINYAGARICKATEANGGGIQVQGNASDVAKQGFFFNKTAFSSDIKSITIVVRGSNKYDTPTTFSVYEGTSVHPTTNKIEGKYTTAADGNFNVFTMTYDFSTVSSKYFTVWNNAVGALYIDKVIITLK